MRRNHIFQRFVAIFILAIGLSSYGCGDTVSISEDVQVPLTSLSLTATPGGAPLQLQPAFSSNTTNYAVNAPTPTTSVTVAAIPKDNTATVTINGTVTTQRSVPLGAPGSTTIITIVLEAQNGAESTYTVTVTRLLSSDNGLKTLTVTPGLLVPDFASDQLTYTVDVATNISNITVSATKSDPNAVMLIESILISPMTVPGGPPASGPVNIPLTGPGTNTVVSITVTAPNGDKKTYTITVNRAASSDNNLSALSVTPGPLNPAFTVNTLSYTVNVSTEITEVIVSATKSDPNAVLSGSIADPGAGQATGQATILLSGPGTPTPMTVTVTAPNGSSQTYAITVNRAASNDNNLSALSLTAGSVPLVLNPPFDRNHLDYTVEVSVGVIEVTVTATKSDPNAVLSGSVADPGAGQATGQATIIFILLPPPQVSITVTAPDGSSQTYKVTVNQVLVPPPSP